ncbi:protein ZGRF1 isoform X1 [Varanus komodoensis]|nr:protein ZGRF1 isoform X1 [Varanus komodoensis]XP_044284829.1 protein ZGRF1 isoform X1 [Varanus komodoensis]
MACQEFTVLYTHQKTKKSKVWQDGILKSTVGGNKATLFDDKGQILDSIFVKFQVKSGDDLESERYLITVEAEKSSETGCSDLPKNTGGPMLPRNCLKSFSSSSLHLPAGLKRKHTGSQGPCRMKKKMAMEEPEIEVSSTSKGLHSSFSSLLFSVPCKKEETNFLRNNDGDAFMKEHEDIESLSVLTVTPCTDKHKVVLSRNHNTDGADAEYIKPEFQLDNGMVKSNYCASSDGTVSQNLRSKAQILALLNREQPVKASGEETIASLQNLSLPSIKSKFQLNGLPSRSTDSFLKKKMTLVSQCANNTNKDSTRHRELLKTEKTVQAKSRWDAYLPLCLTEELSDIDDTEQNNTNASNLHPVKKDLKENSTVNRNQYREDNKQILQVSPSLESNIFPFNKSYVKNQLHGFIPTQSIVSKGNEIEVSSFASNPYLNCKNISKTLKDGIFKSSKCTIIGNLEEICQQSPNESDPVVCSTHFSNNSAQGNLDLDNQFTEVNFSLLETCDFSDTEERELCVKNSVCFKEETETQLEDSVQKNCDTKASSEGKDNLQSAFLQDRDRIPISESQPVKLYDEILMEPNKMKKNCIKMLQHSDTTIVDAKIMANAVDAQNIGDNGNFVCTGRDLLIEKNVHCEMNDTKQKFAEAPSSEVVQITSCLYSDSPTLNSCLSNDGETSTRATVNMIQGHIPFEVVNKSQQKPSECHFSPSPRNEEVVVDMEEQEFLMSRIVPDLSTDNETDLFRMEEPSCPKENDISMLLSTTRTQIPVVTAPVNEELSNLDYSSAKAIQQSFHFSEVNIYDMSEAIVPEDRMCETFTEEKCIGEREVLLTQYEYPNTSEQKQQSKWKKYQNTNHGDLRTQNSSEVSMTDNIRAENILAMSLDDTGEGHSEAINKNPPDSAHLQMMKSMLCKQQRNFSSQDSVSEGKIPPLHFSRKCFTKEAPKITSGLSFPSVEMVKHSNVLKRQICIPVEFQSPAHYKQIFTAALTEHLNILLYDLSLKLHKALGKVDISFCTSMEGGQEQENSAPLCNHKIAAKLLVVKKEGQHKGRLFYACDARKADRCDFFKWLEDVKPGQIAHRPRVVLHDMKSIGTYLRCQNIYLYEECQLLMRKTFDFQRKQFGKMGKFNISKVSLDCDSTGKLYLKLNRKEHSSFYNKDDIWVISKTLIFGPLDTFIACSVFFGPSSSNEVELVPLKGYSPSNWCSNTIVHALLVCNASTELTTLRNIEENIGSAGLPIMQHLLAKSFKSISYSNRIKKQKFKSPASNTNTEDSGVLSQESMIDLANKMIQTFHLNKDQAKALIEIGAMMTSKEIDTEMGKQQATPIKVIHGVFGSGKSYLLAIVTLFLVQIFESSEAMNDKRSVPWKVLISSSTNVAVDRVLLCLLDLGFEEFIRVGSIRKIAKPILPFSLHAGSGPENEQLKELLALMKEDLTPTEKICVRKTIEHHKLGTNKALLQQVRVVGATCAACPFPCMKNLKFPIVVLDECSQMTEPASLLPIARFRCEKLILVGDPKQLPPTIQGSESAHDNGLEQTLFNRLCLMGHEPILLRTQYRCHPIISAISSELFYERNLLNGISELDRTPVVNWLPTLCFYNVNGFEQMERDNSFHNMAESCFIVKLIQSLIISGVEGSMIGVITLYKSQMSKISNLLGAVQSDISQIKAVQVSTVDAFQGAEKEIIVLSCVRTRQVGFIDSEKRVNVALTRGKRHLLIVGNLSCLRKNKLWGSVIQHCAGNKNGLQHVSECEQQLNDIIRSCLERKKEEEISTHTEKSKSKSFLSKTKE